MAVAEHPVYASKVYYSSALDTPVYTAVDVAGTANGTLSANEADASSRGSGGWTEMVATTKSVEYSFDMVYSPGDTAHDAIRDAWLNGTKLDFAFLDGDEGTAETEGIRFVGQVHSFDISEDLADIKKVSVTVKNAPVGDGSAPSWMVVSA